MGDDVADDCAQEGLQINILPRTRPVPPDCTGPTDASQKQTSKTYHRPDPSFTYLLCAFQLLTSLAWGIAYTSSVPSVLKITLVFIFVHFLLSSLIISTLNFFLIKYLLGPNSKILPGKRRGLYDLSAGDGEGKEELEFGYCWDVAIRAFVPVWVILYVVQFLCMPLVGTDHW
jgi:hypothetical protein